MGNRIATAVTHKSVANVPRGTEARHKFRGTEARHKLNKKFSVVTKFLINNLSKQAIPLDEIFIGVREFADLF